MSVGGGTDLVATFASRGHFRPAPPDDLVAVYCDEFMEHHTSPGKCHRRRELSNSAVKTAQGNGGFPIWMPTRTNTRIRALPSTGRSESGSKRLLTAHRVLVLLSFPEPRRFPWREIHCRAQLEEANACARQEAMDRGPPPPWAQVQTVRCTVATPRNWRRHDRTSGPENPRDEVAQVHACPGR